MWPYMGAMGWWMLLWWIAGIVVLILLVRVLVRTSPGSPPGDETPEQILKRRYARGEIDRDEYQRRLEDLRR